MNPKEKRRAWLQSEQKRHYRDCKVVDPEAVKQFEAKAESERKK